MLVRAFSLLIIYILTIIYAIFWAENPLQLIGIFTFALLILATYKLNRNFVFFEPVNLFSVFNIGLLFVLIHHYSFGFNNNMYIITSVFSNSIDILFTKAIYYIDIGYFMVLLGYFKTKKKFTFEITPNKKIKDLSIYIIVFIFLGISTFNFFYNVIIFASGNIVTYFQNISIRSYEFKDSGTTLFYNFGFIAIYLWAYLVLKNKQKSKLFVFAFIFMILIKFSLGRLFQTIVFILTVVSFFYFYNFKDSVKVHLKYTIIFSFFIVSGIFMYFFRLMSSLRFNNMETMSKSDYFLEFLKIDSLTYNIIEKGNLPNLAVFMKIIDSWQDDIGYLYGKSLFSWVYNVFPQFIRPSGYQPSVMIKSTWYSDLVGGSLPPTGYGEMYANFGFIGIIFGMFFFGVIMATAFNMLKKYQNIWSLIISCHIFVSFFLIYPKGEFDNFSFMFFVFLLISYVLILLVNAILKNKTST